jgi:hypothetical protein
MSTTNINEPVPVVWQRYEEKADSGSVPEQLDHKAETRLLSRARPNRCIGLHVSVRQLQQKPGRLRKMQITAEGLHKAAEAERKGIQR